MSLPSGKLFVPDQAIYWLDPKAKLVKLINKRDWLQTHHLPEFVEDPKKDEKSPWTRIDQIEARTEFLKNLGPAGDGFALPGLRKENLELLSLTVWIEYGQPSGEHRSPDGARFFCGSVGFVKRSTSPPKNRKSIDHNNRSVNAAKQTDRGTYHACVVPHEDPMLDGGLRGRWARWGEMMRLNWRVTVAW